MQIGNFQDYRKYLRSVLEDRMQHNPRYSLRAFARDLELSSSRLSDVLKGHKGLSVDSGTAIANRLGLGLIETRYFCDLITAQHARTPSARIIASTRIQGATAMADYKILKDDEFSVIAQWYHLAILELLKPEAKDLTTDVIAHRLGINKLLVEEAVDRMERLELIERTAQGLLLRSVKGVVTSDKIPSEAIRSHHQQVLGKAGEALSNQPLTERDFTSMTVAFDRRLVPEVKNLIERFKSDFLNLVESMQADKQDVYALGIQLFNLTPAPQKLVKEKEGVSAPSIRKKSKEISQ